MKYTIILLLFSCAAWGQTIIPKSQLDSITIVHENHCDTITKKHFIRLGESSEMKLSYLQYKRDAHRIILKGQVVDLTNNRFPFCSIYLAKDDCTLRPIGTTDKKGSLTYHFLF
ncbi:MAG: hypothetical protein ACYDCN_13825 [Bacteroidia bacterium]